MLDPKDLSGILAMMPAFATDDAISLAAANTVDVDRLRHGVDRIVTDGIDVIATTGSFGEGYLVSDAEFELIVRETLRTAAGRVPVFAGCVATSPRDIARRVGIAADAGADGVLLALPFYFPLTVDNAIGFLTSVANRHPDLAVLIYHNPVLHKTYLPSSAFAELGRHRNIVGLKDSHRETRSFIELMQVAPHLRVFVSTRQYYPYSLLGAAGTWSYECWMGPSPLIQLRRYMQCGDYDQATTLIRQLTSPVEGGPGDLRWREVASKIAIRHAGYCDPGPLRVPYTQVPDDVDDTARRRAAQWLELAKRATAELSADVGALG